MEPENQLSAEQGMVTLHLPCQYSYLRIARKSVLDFCACSGMSEFNAAQVEMAVDEACSNIIEHGYGIPHEEERFQPDQGYQICMYREPDAVVIRIEDQGKAFVLDDQKHEDPVSYIENHASRGLGLFIIKNFVDEVHYEPSAEKGNTLTIIKKL